MSSSAWRRSNCGQEPRSHEAEAAVRGALPGNGERCELRPHGVRRLEAMLRVGLLEQEAVCGGEEGERQHSEQHLCGPWAKAIRAERYAGESE